MKNKRPTKKDLEKTIQTYNDAILKVIEAFSSKFTPDEFIHGLKNEQYDALRNLNVIRIDFGDTRTPHNHE